MAGVLAARGTEALVFRGNDGLDELTTTGPSTVWVVTGGAVREQAFDPAELQAAVTASEAAFRRDLARYLVGEISEVSGHLETFVKERPLPDGRPGRGPGLSSIVRDHLTC